MQIRHLSGEHAMFMNHMPAQVHTELANSSTDSNKALARETGKIMREFKLAKSISAAPHVAVVEAEASGISAASSIPRAPLAQNPSPVSSQQRPYICFPHSKYGDKAYACKSAKCAMRGQVALKLAKGNWYAGR